MLLRDPSDQEFVKTMVTPAPHVLTENLEKLKQKWKDIDYCSQHVSTPNVLKQLNIIKGL